MAKKKNKNKKSDPDAPRIRGCLSCNRWHAFVKKIWEDSHELCPEDTCQALINCETIPEPIEDGD